MTHIADRLSVALAALYTLDRLLKLAAVARFFRRPAPAVPERWPSVTLIQPVTRAQHNLRRTLRTRARLDYPAPVQHLLVCDAADEATHALCRSLLTETPGWQAEIVLAAPDGGVLASKIAKLHAALPRAGGQVLCFVDDDVALRPDALRVLVSWLDDPATGAVFGLACYTDWQTLWSSLMSGFVNANALLSYIPLTYLAAPFTITGHCFALRREVFAAVGGFDAMAGRLDDDHELARRVRRHGWRLAQTPLIYDVENRLESLAAYHAQITRWMVLPRQTMMPALSDWERFVILVGSAPSLLPPVLGLLALLTRRTVPAGALAACLALFGAVYMLSEARYLGRRTPVRRWPLLLAVALVTSLHLLVALLSGDTIAWRGQHLRVRRDGTFEMMGAEDRR